MDIPFLLGALALAGQGGREMTMEVLGVGLKRGMVVNVELHWCR